MSTHFVIIGNGAAGYRAAKDLRRADPDAQISVFTEEPYPFYLRRQLGDFLAGNLTLAELIFQSRNTYRRDRIDLFLDTPVERIDPAAHDIVYGAGQRVRFDRLLVATGTRAVRPEVPGADLAGVATFDTLAQAHEVKRLAKGVRQAVILDEGIVGLVMAEGLRALGVRVTQLLAGERFWPQILDETTAGLVEAMLEARGVVLRRRTDVRCVVGAGDHAIGVETAEGEVLPAELVGCGGRRRPALNVLEGSGIEVGRGVRVGAALQTSHPDVFAAGDVAEPAGAGTPAACADGSLASEEACCFCWQRAWAQGGVAAAGMLGNKPKPVRESMRVRTALFGRDLAVMGRAHLPEGGNVKAVELRSDGGRFRRLVYEDDRLVGAAVWGTGEWVHKLNRLVGEGASREAVEGALGLGPEPQAQDLLPRTFAAHCPICAAELVVREGTPLGSRLDCVACSSSLVVCWDGRRGWLEIPGE